MKIQGQKQTGQALEPARPGRVETARGDFNKVLSDIRSKGSPPAENTPSSMDTVKNRGPRLESGSALEVLSAQRFTLSRDEAEGSAVKRVEQLLDALESYSQALSDPGKNLRDIAPLVQLMEDETEKLTGWAEGLPGGSAIKDLVDKTAILSAVETIRFNRGDYL